MNACIQVGPSNVALKFGVAVLYGRSRLFQLETEPSSAGPVAHLPPSVTILPRSVP